MKFDGPALAGKTIDVTHLAPSLLAFSKLMKSTNAYVNGDAVSLRILVSVNEEQNCFELDLNFVMGAWGAVKSFLLSDDFVAAEKLLHLVLGGVGSLSLYGLIKWLKGRKVAGIKVAESGEYTITDDSGETCQVPKAVFDLYSSPETRQHALDAIAPLHESGYESMEFYNKKEKFMKIVEEDVPKKDGSDLPALKSDLENVAIIRTIVGIIKPAYEGNSQWNLIYKKPIHAKMSDLEWLAKFQSRSVRALPKDKLEADLEERYVTTEEGEIIGNPSYQVLKVYRVVGVAQQQQEDIF